MEVNIGDVFGKLEILLKMSWYPEEQWFECRCLECKGHVYKTLKELEGLEEDADCGCSSKSWKKTYKHGLSNERLFAIWTGMKQRCYNHKQKSYQYYGARGIKVCDEWLGEDGFINFYNWSLEHGYSEERLPSGTFKYSIDRIDVDGNYCPENCRWADPKTQANNRQRNK